eukprot:1384472-Amorphochlora_amoeboformis.AAC.3
MSIKVNGAAVTIRCGRRRWGCRGRWRWSSLDGTSMMSGGLCTWHAVVAGVEVEIFALSGSMWRVSWILGPCALCGMLSVLMMGFGGSLRGRF